MNIIKENLLVNQMENNKWYCIESGRDFNNTYTKIMLNENWLHITYQGIDFEEDFKMKFKYSKLCLDEIFQHNYNKNYIEPIKKSLNNMEWILKIASDAFTMLLDLDRNTDYVKKL